MGRMAMVRRCGSVSSAASGSTAKRRQSPGYAGERPGAAIREVQTRPRHQVLDGAGDQDLVGRGLARDPGGERHGDAAHPLVAQLAFAGVQPGPGGEAEVPGRVGDRFRAADGPGRPVERRYDAVARQTRARGPGSGRAPGAASAWNRSWRSAQRRSPSATARPAVSATSLTRTVARTWSGTPAGRVPVTKASISSTRASTSPTNRK